MGNSGGAAGPRREERRRGYRIEAGRSAREWSVGCGFFFALFVYFVEEVFEFYFLLGGH